MDFARLFLGWGGLTINDFGYTDVIYLIFNIVGGVLGIILVKYVLTIMRSYAIANEEKA